MLLGGICHAQPAVKTISINLLTKHYASPERYNMKAFNEDNVGVGFDLAVPDSQHTYLVGYYRNSFNKNSVYAAKNFLLKQYRDLELTLAAGLVSGYHNHPVLLAPAVKYKNLRASLVGEAFALQGVWDF